MAFKFPNNVESCPVGRLHMAQVRIMADWLAVRNRVEAAKKRADADTILVEAIKAQPQRAQAAYEAIVLLQQPGGIKPTTDSEKRFLEITTSVAMATVGDVEKRAEEFVVKAANQATAGFEAAAKKALATAAEKVAPFVIKEAGKTRTVKGVLPPEFKMMLELATARVPIMLVGPAGCGKTYLCEKLAEALNMEFSDQSCSEGMSESVFNGKLLPVGKNGAFEHVESPFMRRYEKGGVMLLDEIDAGDPNLFTYINKAIANKSYTAEQRYKNPVVKKSPNFVLAAAANTYGSGADAMYVGRNQLDAATLDRFKIGMITMDYSRDVEASIASTELCEWAWKIRANIRKNALRRIMSTRVIEHLATMTSMHKWGPEQWAKAYFTGWTEAERTLVTI